MATKTTLEHDSLTTAVERKDNSYKGPTVEVFLPELEDPGDAGLAVDQYEHVTLSNENGDNIYYIKRGEKVDVPVPVFMALKARYPKL